MTAYRQVEKNIFRTWLLITIFIIFISALGYLLAYLFKSPYILWLALFFALLTSFISWLQGPKIVLALAGAKKISKDDYPELFRLVENVAITAGLPSTPEIYIIPTKALNAFATGKNPQKSYIAFTTGILNVLERRELEGVIAHEISHIKNRDTLVMLIAAILAGSVAILSDFFLRLSIYGHRNDEERKQLNPLFIILGIILAILAPIIAQLIQLAISRKREFLADASGALLTRDPIGLANALEKLERYERNEMDISPAISSLFFVSPQSKHTIRKWLINLFSTHPPIEERIKALKNML